MGMDTDFEKQYDPGWREMNEGIEQKGGRFFLLYGQVLLNFCFMV